MKRDFLVLELTPSVGIGVSEGVQTDCRSSNTTFTWTRRSKRIESADFVISLGAWGPDRFPFHKLRLDAGRQQYTMAFVLESEAHSSTGNTWAKYNFKMYYNLDDSYPEPATYFSTAIHAIDLLRPVMVPFEEKEQEADVIWLISNCDVSVAIKQEENRSCRLGSQRSRRFRARADEGDQRSLVRIVLEQS